MTPIVFLDTETTSLRPDRRAWEIGMIRRDEQGQRETQFFVEIDLATADQFGLKVGRFYDRHPLGRVLSGLDENLWDNGEDIYSELRAAMTVARFTHGAHIVGMVPNFDTEVLANLLREQQLTPAWHYHLIDVENLAVGWLHAQQQHGYTLPTEADLDQMREFPQPPYSSDELSWRCGVEPPDDDERHTALGDARWVMRLYDRITGVTASAAAEIAVAARPSAMATSDLERRRFLAEQARPHHRPDRTES